MRVFDNNPDPPPPPPRAAFPAAAATAAPFPAAPVWCANSKARPPASVSARQTAGLAASRRARRAPPTGGCAQTHLAAAEQVAGSSSAAPKSHAPELAAGTAVGGEAAGGTADAPRPRRRLYPRVRACTFAHGAAPAASVALAVALQHAPPNAYAGELATLDAMHISGGGGWSTATTRPSTTATPTPRARAQGRRRGATRITLGAVEPAVAVVLKDMLRCAASRRRRRQSLLVGARPLTRGRVGAAARRAGASAISSSGARRRGRRRLAQRCGLCVARLPRGRGRRSGDGARCGRARVAAMRALAEANAALFARAARVQRCGKSSAAPPSRSTPRIGARCSAPTLDGAEARRLEQQLGGAAGAAAARKPLERRCACDQPRTRCSPSR